MSADQETDRFEDISAVFHCFPSTYGFEVVISFLFLQEEEAE